MLKKLKDWNKTTQGLFVSMCLFTVLICLAFVQIWNLDKKWTSSNKSAASSSSFNHNSWSFLQEPPFWVFYQNNDRKNAQKILAILKGAHPRLATEIGFTLQTPTGVFLCPSLKVFRQLTGGQFPKWGEGVADVNQNIIILKSPRWSQPISELERVVVHELVHLVLAGAVDNRPIPRWFNEGLAVYYSGEEAFASSSLISKALISQSIIPLEDIDEVLAFHKEKAQLAYQESFLAIQYLIETFGTQALQAIINGFKTQENQDQIFLNAIGLDLWEFETQWYDYIQKKYRWHFLSDLDLYFWILILLVFVVVFIAIRRRNRRILQQWEEEEAYEPEEDLQ